MNKYVNISARFFLARAITKEANPATQKIIKVEGNNPRTLTLRDDCEHDNNFYLTKKINRSVRAKLSTPPHKHKTHKPSELITLSPTKQVVTI